MILHAVARLDLASFGGTISTGPDLSMSKSPLGDVEVMGAPVGHAAAAVLAEGPPRREMLVHAARAEHRTVRPHRRGSQPAVPIQAGLQLFAGQFAGRRRTADAHHHLLDLAELAVADQFARIAELLIRPLLAAGLEDDLRLADRSITLFASMRLFVSGFSQYMSLPALQASRMMMACQWSGVAQATAWMSFRAMISRKSL